MRSYPIGRVIAVLGLLVVLGLTLVPLPNFAKVVDLTPFSCLVCGPRGAVDVVLNVILFVPFAAGLRLAGVSTGRVILAAMALTLFVETAQRVLPGRDPSLSDLLTNTTGGIVGAVLAARRRTWLLPEPAAAAWLVAAWTGVWLGILLVTAWLFQPWPPHGSLRMAWGVRITEYATYTGRIEHATIDRIPHDSGSLGDTPAILQHLSTGNLALDFAAVVGPPIGDWAPAVAILDAHGLAGAVFEIHDDVIFRIRTNASRFRLQPPGLLLPGGRPRTGGVPMHITARGSRDSLALSSSFGEVRRQRTFFMSPSLGWSLLLPFEYAYGREVHVLTALWIAGLLAPLGYWMRTVRGSGLGRALGLGAAPLMGLAFVPWLTGFPPVHWSQWLAAATGLAGGWAAARRATYLGGRCASPSASESSSS